MKKLVSTDYNVYDYTPGIDPTPSPTPIIPTPTPVPDPTPTPTPFIPFEQYAGTKIFKPSGKEETYVVPEGVDRLRVDMWGAGGGSGRYYGRNAGGSGGYSVGYIPVTPGETLIIGVGETSKFNWETSRNETHIPGYSPGGSAGRGGTGMHRGAGSGGGMSGIFRGSISAENALLIAGGGGGAAGSGTAKGAGVRWFVRKTEQDFVVIMVVVRNGTQTVDIAISGGDGTISSSGGGVDGWPVLRGPVARTHLWWWFWIHWSWSGTGKQSMVCQQTTEETLNHTNQLILLTIHLLKMQEIQIKMDSL